MVTTMSKKQENLLHLGADLDKRFVSKFRNYCRKKNFKQLALIRHLVQWWLDQDVILQEHVYYGRWDDVAKYLRKQADSSIDKDQAIADDISSARPRKEKKRTQEARKPSEAG
jgi:hypothetical protein